MHGPTCIFWANLTPFSLEALVESKEQWLRTPVSPLSGAPPGRARPGVASFSISFNECLLVEDDTGTGHGHSATPATRLSAPRDGPPLWPGRAAARSAAATASGLPPAERARVRPHCCFAPALIHFVPDSRTYWVPLFLKRHCDRTLEWAPPDYAPDALIRRAATPDDGVHCADVVDALKVRKSQAGPDVGPTAAVYNCIPTRIRGPTRISWSNLTPSSLEALRRRCRRRARRPRPLARRRRRRARVRRGGGGAGGSGEGGGGGTRAGRTEPGGSLPASPCQTPGAKLSTEGLKLAQQ
jgi:hypothetical protein